MISWAMLMAGLVSPLSSAERREPISAFPAGRSPTVLAARNDGRQGAAGRPQRQRRRHPDPGGLACGAEVTDLPAALAGQVTQGGVGVYGDGGSRSEEHT